jgi:hypothetical protein
MQAPSRSPRRRLYREKTCPGKPDHVFHSFNNTMRALVAPPVLALLVGCPFQDKPAPTAVFPDSRGVTKLVVFEGLQISNRTAIEQFLGALAPLDSGWLYTWHTYATPQATVVLLGPGESALCRVDLGRNWLGSDCGQAKSGSQWPPYVRLSPEQARWFRDSVGGKWEVK